MNEKRTTVAILLGNRLNDDGSPSDTLIRRMQMALRYNEEDDPTYIIVTGGIANPTAGIPEADVMYAYLTAHGVAGSKIIREGKSMTTVENARFSIPIAKELHPDRITVITTYDHLSRPYLNGVEIFCREILGAGMTCDIMFYTNQ